ncbi:DEAD/DEAH box helicase [Pigmentiphaga daeguensis]|uniref:DEAD/DEAH box helicase n=1 Tax=Pigmentiphaga daeguensis TaxID=414049 RepID=A0ABN1B8C2_9BURK
MREIDLRPYQHEAIGGLRDGLRAGHRAQILMAPTGAGKTVIAAHLMREAARKASRVAFMVDRVALVDQTSATLDYYGIDHGVVQAGHWRRRLYERVQVCSAQTIEKRGFFPDLDLLIVDECHAMRQATTALIKARQGLTVIGLSATPFAKGLAGLYSNLVSVCTTNELMAEGYLVPLRMYAAKAIDMTGAKTVAGEWSDKEAEDRGLKIVGDIVTEWQVKTQKHFGGPVKTIVFSATVAHGRELCAQFQAAGFNFQQVSYRDADDDQRRALIEEFRKPDSEIIGLVSCEVFTKGFDVPDVLCGIAARPYRKSLSSHVQQMGRVMRPSPGKDFGLWLDHSGNLMRFRSDVEELFTNGLSRLADGNLDSKARAEPTPRELERWKCSCGQVFDRVMAVCPSCGKERVNRALVENVAGVMEAVGHDGQAASKVPPFLQDRAHVWRQLCGMAVNRKGDDFDAARRWAQRQYHSLYGEFSLTRYSPDLAIDPTEQLARRVKHNILKWAKGQAKAAA